MSAQEFVTSEVVSFVESQLATRYARPNAALQLREDIISQLLWGEVPLVEAVSYFEHNREVLLKFGNATKFQIAVLGWDYGFAVQNAPTEWAEAYHAANLHVIGEQEVE